MNILKLLILLLVSCDLGYIDSSKLNFNDIKKSYEVSYDKLKHLLQFKASFRTKDEKIVELSNPNAISVEDFRGLSKYGDDYLLYLNRNFSYDNIQNFKFIYDKDKDKIHYVIKKLNNINAKLRKKSDQCNIEYKISSGVLEIELENVFEDDIEYKIYLNPSQNSENKKSNVIKPTVYKDEKYIQFTPGQLSNLKTGQYKITVLLTKSGEITSSESDDKANYVSTLKTFFYITIN